MAGEVVLDYTNLPEDILPTSRFFSVLPGFRQEEPPSVTGGEYFVWDGVTKLKGREVLMRTVTVWGETNVFIRTDHQEEMWQISVKYSDAIVFMLRAAQMNLSLVNMNVYVPGGEKIAHLMAYCKEWRKNSPNPKPVEYPVRLRSDILLEESRRYIEGFESVNVGLDYLILLRNSILAATPMTDDQRKLLPYWQSLTPGY